MRRLFCVLAPAAVIAVMACGSFSDGAPDEADASVDAPPSSSDVTAEDAAFDVDAGDGGCSARIANGETDRWAFDDGTCEGWQVFGGGAVGTTEVARCGPASCKVCGSGNDVTLLREVTIARAGGLFGVDFAIRDDSTQAGWAASLEVLRDTVQQSSANAKGAMTKTDWAHGQITVDNPGPSTSVKIRIHGYPPDGGGCFYVDEVSFGHQ